MSVTPSHPQPNPLAALEVEPDDRVIVGGVHRAVAGACHDGADERRGAPQRRNAGDLGGQPVARICRTRGGGGRGPRCRAGHSATSPIWAAASGGRGEVDFVVLAAQRGAGDAGHAGGRSPGRGRGHAPRFLPPRRRRTDARRDPKRLCPCASSRTARSPAPSVTRQSMQRLAGMSPPGPDKGHVEGDVQPALRDPELPGDRASGGSGSARRLLAVGRQFLQRLSSWKASSTKWPLPGGGGRRDPLGFRPRPGGARTCAQRRRAARGGRDVSLDRARAPRAPGWAWR